MEAHMFLGVFFICLSVIILALVLVGSRNPSKPAWASDLMVQYVWVIAVLGLAAAGLVLVGFAFGGESQTISVTEAISSLATVGLTIAGIWLISPKKRLRQYAAANGTVTH
jgi:hypothetical protein